MGREPVVLGMSEPWRGEAACRDSFDLMFNPDTVAVAVALCDRCPVFDECEAYAAVFEPPSGVWFGVEANPRYWAKRKRLAHAR